MYVPVSYTILFICSDDRIGYISYQGRIVFQQALAFLLQVIIADDNPVISFKGSDALGAYEFSYTVNNGSIETVTTTSGSDTATIAIPLSSAGVFTYKLTSVKDLTTGCSQAKNLEVTVTIQPKPTKAHIQLNN